MNKQKQVELGTILCKMCGELIDTFDAEKVMVYYSLCDKEECQNRNNEKYGIYRDCGD